jgi:hypothetical protein
MHAHRTYSLDIECTRWFKEYISTLHVENLLRVGVYCGKGEFIQLILTTITIREQLSTPATLDIILWLWEWRSGYSHARILFAHENLASRARTFYG